jgi:hypothetical protein
MGNHGFNSGEGFLHLGLEEQVERRLENYIRDLARAHIQLNDQDDELVWDIDPEGVYTPKAGYIKLSTDAGPREEVWWWRKIWKLKVPIKDETLIVVCT